MSQDRFQIPLDVDRDNWRCVDREMMAQKAKKMGFNVLVLDPTPNCPAAQVANKQIVGDFYNEDKLRERVARSEVTTYDIEHINTNEKSPGI